MIDLQTSGARHTEGRPRRFLVGAVASLKETSMVFCHFCHWTKVEPGTNCPKCNTYMPKESSNKRGPDWVLRPATGIRARQ